MSANLPTCLGCLLHVFLPQLPPACQIFLLKATREAWTCRGGGFSCCAKGVWGSSWAVSLTRRWKATACSGLPGALRSTWSWLQKEGYMDDWANANGFDWCNNLLLDKHSHKLDTQEIKSLAMGCTCAVLRCSWGHALFHLPKFLAKNNTSEQYVSSSLNFDCSLCPFLQYLLPYPFP